jgi:hypothetical protein
VEEIEPDIVEGDSDVEVLEVEVGAVSVCLEVESGL